MISAVIVAGGKGKRMGQDCNKQYIKLNGKEIITITLEAFNAAPTIDEIILVVGENEIEFCITNIIKKYKLTKVKKVISGGAERIDSVYKGLISCNENTEVVIIHDGARPFVTEKMIKESIEAARVYGACTTAMPVKDTIKIANEDKYIVKTLNRNELFAIQTPQAFQMQVILEAHEAKLKNRSLATATDTAAVTVTDDTMLVEALGRQVKIVEGSYLNIKITTPEDLIFGEAILKI